MADGKQQPQQSAETAKAAAAQSAKREALLAKAKERIDKVDVADDQKHDAKEVEVKKKALEFVSNECLTLPEDRFFRLIDAIEVRMKQKEAYKQNLVEEFKKVRKEIADSIVQTGSPIRENTAILKTEYVPKKLTKDMGDNLTSYPTTVISNNFKPERFNATYDTPMLEVMEKYPKSADQFYQQIRKEDSRTVGFLMYWGPEHPAFKELQTRGMARAIEMITKVEARLRTEFGVPRNSDIGNGDAKEKAKILMKRVAEWKTGDKFNAAANEAADMFNFDRKLFVNKFASHPKGMNEEDYTKYVKRSANYLEYAASKWETGKREFFEQLEKNPETVAGFITNWNVNNQIFQALALRWKADTVGIWVSRLRNEAMRRYGISVEIAKPENHDKIRDLASFAMNRTVWEKAGDRAWAAKEAFSGNPQNDVRAARYLNFATVSGNSKEWISFVIDLKDDPKRFAQFIYSWNENSPLGTEIKRNNGADAIHRLNALRKEAITNYSMLDNFSGMPKQHALGAIEKWLTLNSGMAEKRAALVEKIKENYPDHRKYVEAAFAEMREWVLQNKWAMVEKAKKRLVDFSNATLLPLHLEAQKLPGYSDTNGNRFMHPQHQQVASLRVAIEAMNVIKLSDTGEEWYSDIVKVAKSDANNAWVEAKMQQVSRIMDGGDLRAVVGFGTEYKGAVRVQKPMTGKQFDDEIRNKDIQDVDSEAFYQTLCQANVLGELNAANLISRWGEFRLMKIALHWGIVSGGKEDQKFNKSWAFAKLKNTKRDWVATTFESALKEVVSNRDKDMERLDVEKADLKAVKDVLKKIKPAANEAEIDKTIADIKQAEGTVGLRALEKFKGWTELKAEEIESFFSALHKIQAHEVAATAKKIKTSEIRDDEIANVGEFQAILKAAEASYAKTKSPEDKSVIDLLKSGKLKEIGKTEDPKGTTPRPRKVSELGADSVKILAEAALKYLGEKSKLREYLSQFRTHAKQTRVASSSDILAKNAKPLEKHLVKTKGLSAPEAAKEDAKFDQGMRAISDAESVVAMRKVTGVVWAPTTEGEKSTLAKAAKDAAEAEKNGISLELGDNSALRESYEDRPKGKDRSLSQFLADVAEGKEPLNKEQAEVWKSVREENPKVGKSVSEQKWSSSSDDRAYERGGAFSNSTSVESFMESKPGDRLQIGDSVTAVKTEGGGLEVITASRKLRFSSKEAEGAVQQIDLLKEAGAEFLIPAMNEIAFASQTQIKDGVGRAESARILSTLSRAFGFDSVMKETDPKLMLEKFKNAASGASGDGGIWAKARSLGILDPANNALKSEILVERMSGTVPSAKEGTPAETAA